MASSISTETLCICILSASISSLSSMILFLSISALALNCCKCVPLFLLRAVLFLEQKRILVLQSGDLVVEAEVIALELPQFVQVGLQGAD